MLHRIEEAYRNKKNRRKETLLAYYRASKQYYVNKAFGLDIETTSWVDEEGIKRAHLVSYGLDLGSYVEGRQWESLIDELKTFSEGLESISPDIVAIVWIHNLSYESQFLLPRLAKIYPIHEMLALDVRKPLYYKWGSLEFRCSYLLSGKSLARIGKDLGFDKSSDWDYTLQRNHKTPLSALESIYQRKDVEIVIRFIEGEIAYNKNITRIPLTRTGYVRRAIKQRSNTPEFKSALCKLPIQVSEYQTLYRAFMGGYTHASKSYIGQTLKDVASYDIVSSYPSVMLSEIFPTKLLYRNVKLTKQSILRGSKLGYLYVFRVKFTNLRAKANTPDYYISLHKTRSKSSGKDIKHAMTKFDYIDIGSKTEVFNGRIVKHEGVLTTYITNVDLSIIESVYDYDEIEIDRAHVYEGGLLPLEYFKLILELYEAKETLKGVEGKEYEYNKSKEMLNSLYGMTVEQILKDEISYTSEGWIERSAETFTPEEVEAALDEENAKKKRFKHYSWGVFITAYARRNLWAAILQLGSDYVYSDTDSVKFLNHNKHKAWFKSYNEKITKRVANTIRRAGIEPPIMNLGEWELEGVYNKFKTLGAKRYLVEDEGVLELTCAGLSKQAVKYINNTSEPFKTFSDGLEIPPEHTHKRTHFYSDEPFKALHTDYLGNVAYVEECAYVYLEDASFKLSLEGYVKEAIEKNLRR